MKQMPNKDFYNFKLYTELPSNQWTQNLTPSQLQATTVVVVQDANAETLALLEKILGAVRQDLNKDCLLIQEKQAVAFKDIKQITPVQHLLVFGWAAPNMGLHLTIQPYQPVVFDDVQLLFAPDLTTIAANKHKEKQQLWRQLQQLFL
jgi:hypothetical protein